ncbi:helicase-associated domain-containing protein [Paenibacillus sp. MMS18-CY102]|uniref:helicase-associated domain-containing protein n=1 Tax=Paenibacillus sp. MMS18-CY102 TaxID=2682849 RepID=UPI00136607BD|nr:helicase-associated domain-containing protein [Paenibacillus sp. MMS18-CY102]MWC26733.1 hypothetical protein [Paenibacillus sp. MMS18-CY102]
MMLTYWTGRMPDDAMKRVQAASIWPNTETVQWPDAALVPELLRMAQQRLSPHGKRLLAYWIQKVGPTPMQEERVHIAGSRETGLAGSEVRAALRELCEGGILFAVRKSWGERLLFLPRDSYMAWRRVQGLSETYWKAQETASDQSEEALNRSNGQVPLGRRLLRAYVALKRTDLKLTAKGLFPKKTIVDVLSALAWKQADDIVWLFGFVEPVHHEHYPAPFAFVLDIAAKLGLLKRVEGEAGYVWDDGQLEQWLAGSPVLREAELLRLVTMAYGLESCELALFVSELLLLEPTIEYAAQLPLADAQNRWIHVMNAFGWANITVQDNGVARFCWLIDPWATEQPVAAEEAQLTEDIPLIALPDGELIVSPNASYALRWTLEQVAQWIRDDAVSIYRLTSRSIADAVEDGIDASELLDTLHQASGGLPVPDELVRAIQHWAACVNRTSLEEVLLLRCDTVDTADAASCHPALAGLLTERIGERCFIVQPADVAKLRQQLERAGWPLAKNNSLAMPALQQGSAARELVEAGPFVVDAKALHIYELVSPAKFAEGNGEGQHAAVPAQWPSSWTGQLRAYHHSTRRQMVESALAWGAPIEIKTEGRLVELVPERLNGYADRWEVSGFLRGETDEAIVPVDLSPHMWEEMRIIVPSAYADTKPV